MIYSVIRIAISMVLSMVLTVVLLVACSGGETGTGIAGQPKISVGAITGFGSVFVNGVEFDTSNATVYVNDLPATEQDLSIGMVVAVVGSSNAARTRGKADAIYYENEVRGMVLSNDRTGTLEIMGQTVNYNADTLFETAVDTVKSITDIPVGGIVEVSGYRTAGNELHATELALVASGFSSGTQISVKGVIDSVNVNRFTLGNLTVVVDSSTVFAGNIPNQQLAVGMSVKVKSQRGLVNGELQADRILLNKRKYAGSGDSVEVEGIISNLDKAAGEFTLNGYTVYYSSQTDIKNGGVVLADGVKAKVEGVLISDSQMEAKDISFSFKNNTDIIARVSSVDTVNNQFTVLGESIQVTNNTLMKDVDLKIKRFSLTDVNPGDQVEIHAYKSVAPGTVTAGQFIRLASNSPDAAVELQGVLEQVSATTIVVAGISVDIASLPSPPQISAADVGRAIIVKGSALLNATQITATDVTFK